jgi:hypothetical protein
LAQSVLALTVHALERRVPAEHAEHVLQAVCAFWLVYVVPAVQSLQDDWST